MSFMDASSGRMHLVKVMQRDVTGIKMGEVPVESLDQIFIRHLMFRTGQTSRRYERVHAIHENDAEYRFDGARHKLDSCI